MVKDLDNGIKWRGGKTNVRDTKTDAEIIKIVYIIPNSKTIITYHILFNCVKYKMQAKNNNSNLIRTEIQYKLTHPL